MEVKYSPLSNELDLVESAVTDDHAFSQLYEHYFPQVYGFVYRRLGNKHAAEDVVSQVFLKMVEHLPRQSFSAKKPFNAWLFRVANTTLIDHYRATGRKTTEALPVDDAIPSDAMSSEHETEIVLERQRLELVLTKLSVRNQRIIQLKYFAELSNQEIAGVLKCTPNNVGVLLHRALKQAHKAYQKYAE